jgi:hypothetical protein
MIFKLAQAAEKTWRRLDGHNQLSTFTDGIEVVRSQAQAAAACRLQARTGLPTFEPVSIRDWEVRREKI